MTVKIDFSRLREAVAGPGIDPRCWICMGRVDVDDDATVWDDELGWLCDVTAVSGPFQGGRLPQACRQASFSQGDDVGVHHPPRQGGLVIVMFPSGDPNEDSVIVGQLHNTDDAGAPAEVNGTEIDEAFAAVTHITVLPDEDLDQQWRNVRITGDAMVLGAEDADQAYARGDDLADALDSFLGDLTTFVTAIAVAPVNIAGPNVLLDPATTASMLAAIETLQAARNTYLSTRIKGD